MKLVATESLSLHAEADRIPMMDAAQEASFREDIGQRGIKVPVEITRDNIIVDGRSRLLAAKALGIERVPVIEAPLGDESPFLYMLRAAIKRRHLTPDQLACLALEEMEYLAAESRSKRAQVAGLAGGRGRSKEVETDSSADTSTAKLTRDRSTDARPAAAKQYGVSERKLREAQLIKRHSPDLYEQVKIGGERLAVARRGVQREQKRQALDELQQQAMHTPTTWEVRTGDCLAELNHIEPGSVRLIFADSPYNIGIDYGSGVDADQRSDAEFLDWCRQWMEACAKLLTDDGSMWVMINDEYADHFGILLREAGLHRRSWIKWYETFGINCTNNFNRCSRHIFYMVNDQKNFVFNDEAVRRPSARITDYNDARADPAGKLWDNVWQIPRLVGTSSERLPDFPTQLPLALVQPIVECASNPRDLVMDPFSGSGTTGAAAVATGRRYIGIEQNETYARVSVCRLRAAAGQTVTVPQNITP